MIKKRIIVESVCLRLTKWILGSNPNLLTGLSRTSLVRCNNPELVFLVLLQSRNNEGCLMDQVSIDLGPPGTELVLHLDGVAQDGTASIGLGRGPGQSN